MKEFDYILTNLFTGLNAKEVIRKKEPGLEECHNIEPLENDYTLHSIILDLNATGQDWNNSQDLINYWEDNQDDDFIDEDDDDFEDL